MSMRTTLITGFLGVLAVAAAAPGRPADEPKGPTAEDKAAAVQDLALAYRIADAGRKAGSAEALLAAAKILSRVNQQFALVAVDDVKPVLVKRGDKEKPKVGDPIKEEGKLVALDDDIKTLKEDARKLNNPKDEALAALIDKVPEGARGSVKGPLWITNQYCTAATSAVYNFNFIGGEPAKVFVRNRDGEPLKLEIYNEQGYCVGTQEGTDNLEIDWTPRMTRPFQVIVSYTGGDEDVQARFGVYKN